jgi:hypothetical protein
MSEAVIHDVADGLPLRRRASIICLAVAFSVYLAINSVALGIAFTALAALVLAAVVLACFGLPSWGENAFARLSAITAAMVALAVPLGPIVWAGTSIPAAVHGNMVWPQILVLLFAGRVLAADAEQRFIAFWREPTRHSHARTQSLAGAIVTGACLVLVFYQLVGDTSGLSPEALDPWSITRRALAGETFVHVAIVALFAIVVAAILDAALALAGELQGLAALRRTLANAPRDEAAARLARFSHTRPLQELIGHQPALVGLHLASRRLIRALVSFLPLFGFLGTVIGLTAAIGGLPQNLGPEAAGNLDIGASLVGLAVKFETTLIGLVGALIASLLLALIERREGEMIAETRHLIEAGKHVR